MIDKNIEQVFKDALEGYQVPYDASSWESLNKKLNKINPTNGSIKLWPWIVGSLLVLTVSSLVFIGNSPEKIAKNDSNKTTFNKDDKNKTATDTDKRGEKNQQLENNLVNNTDKNLIVEQNTINQNQIKETSSAEEIKLAAGTVIDESVKNNYVTQDEIKTAEKVTVYNLDEKTTVVCPNLVFSCVGEVKDISNTNSIDLILLDPFNNQITIAAKSVKRISIVDKGTYRIGTTNQDGYFVELGKQIVNESPNLDMSLEELNYLNGLPTLPINVKSSELSYNLLLNNKLMQQTSSLSTELYLFYKGNVEVTITACNEFKCNASVSKSVSIESDYNLLAVNAFDPFSSDNRKSTFMPYALTLRKTAFKLLIIDPADGGIVFESNDASNAWDGYDKRNGKMINANKACIWKVTIHTPEQKENREYKGTIVRL
jgi:hypothetical protein